MLIYIWRRQIIQAFPADMGQRESMSQLRIKRSNGLSMAEHKFALPATPQPRFPHNILMCFVFFLCCINIAFDKGYPVLLDTESIFVQLSIPAQTS